MANRTSHFNGDDVSYLQDNDDVFIKRNNNTISMAYAEQNNSPQSDIDVLTRYLTESPDDHAFGENRGEDKYKAGDRRKNYYEQHQQRGKNEDGSPSIGSNSFEIVREAAINPVKNRTSSLNEQAKDFHKQLNELGDDVSDVSTGDSEVDKMITCAVCSRLFSNPKMLPCLHTFCQSCLENNMTSGANNSDDEGDVVKCPSCHGFFQRPLGGLGALTTNTLFARISEARRSQSSVSPPNSASANGISSHPLQLFCTLCAESDCIDTAPPAAYQCTDCGGDYLCVECAAAHRKQRLLKSHQLTALDSNLELQDSQSQMCQLHPSCKISCYCADCLHPVCDLCRTDALSSTNCSHTHCVDMRSLAESSRAQLEEDIELANQMADTASRLVASIEAQKRTFLAQVDEAKTQINEAAELAHGVIEEHRKQLLDETSSIVNNTIRELDKVCAASFCSYLNLV